MVGPNVVKQIVIDQRVRSIKYRAESGNVKAVTVKTSSAINHPKKKRTDSIQSSYLKNFEASLETMGGEYLYL